MILILADGTETRIIIHITVVVTIIIIVLNTHPTRLSTHTKHTLVKKNPPGALHHRMFHVKNIKFDVCAEYRLHCITSSIVRRVEWDTDKILYITINIMVFNTHTTTIHSFPTECFFIFYYCDCVVCITCCYLWATRARSRD